MQLDPHSEILGALYAGKREEADRLAGEAAELSVFEAAALGQNDQLRRQLDRDPALANAWAPDGVTPLGLAAFFAGAATVRLLLERGAEVGATARNFMQVQPLHAAVASRNAESVTILLEHGADPNARQQVGYTPLMGAASAGRQDLVELLIQHGAEPAAVNDEGKTAAQIARERGQVELADRLEITRGAGESRRGSSQS